MTKLRIIKRDDKYVVQVGVKRFFTRRLYWKDMHTHFLDANHPLVNRIASNSGYQPFPNTVFLNLEDAKAFCAGRLILDHSDVVEVCKTYDTNLDDALWTSD